MYHYEEVQTLSELRFRFREASQPHTYVSWLASELSEGYPPEFLLRGSSIVSEWNELAVREILELILPENGRFMLMAKDHPSVTPKEGWKNEKWYGTEYWVEKLDSELLRKVGVSSLFLKNFQLYIDKYLGCGTEWQFQPILAEAKSIYPHQSRCPQNRSPRGNTKPIFHFVSW